MNNKLLLSVFVLVFVSLALVSAQISISSPADVLTKTRSSTTFTVTNPITSSPVNVTISTPISITDSKGKIIPITVSPSAFTLASGATQTLTVSYSSVPSNFVLGSYSASINAIVPENTSDNATTSVSFINSYCDKGDVPINGSILDLTKITDNKLDNTAAWTWHPLDNIEIAVRVHNSGDNDLDTTLEYGLYDPSTNSFIDLNQDTVDLSVNSGSSEDTTLKFQVPSDIVEGTYNFYVKDYETEKDICTDIKDSDYFQSVDISKQTRAVVLDSISIQSPSLCGDTSQLKASLANIGKDDESRVLVTVFNRELGINQNQVIKSLNSGDSQSINFDINVPQNATEKTYPLEMTTYFNYHSSNSGCSSDTDTECYSKNSGDIDKTFTPSLQVQGNCQKPVTTPTDIAQITASLQSDAVAGGEILVKATVKNIGTTTSSFIITASGIESFATLEKIDPQSITLAAGQSQDVLVYLKANTDASGDYTFNVRALSGSTIKDQPLTITVQPKKTVSLNFLSNLGSNWFILVIVLINVVLIVLIIIVAVRIARK